MTRVMSVAIYGNMFQGYQVYLLGSDGVWNLPSLNIPAEPTKPLVYYAKDLLESYGILSTIDSYRYVKYIDYDNLYLTTGEVTVVFVTKLDRKPESVAGMFYTYELPKTSEDCRDIISNALGRIVRKNYD